MTNFENAPTDLREDYVTHGDRLSDINQELNFAHSGEADRLYIERTTLIEKREKIRAEVVNCHL